MAYIANKPVRFDRSYAIGEVIPDEVIDPKMTNRLIDMGRILCVDLPASGGTETHTVSAPENAPDGTEIDGGTNTHGETESQTEGAEGVADETENPAAGGEDTVPSAPDGSGEFICPQCGRSFGSRNALSAHARSHKE